MKESDRVESADRQVDRRANEYSKHSIIHAKKRDVHHPEKPLTAINSHNPVTGLKFDLVGIGVSVWDRVLLVDSYPQVGSVARASRRIEGVGGGVTVAMATAARLGSNAAMIDCLGDDVASAQILNTLQREGVATFACQRINDKSASIASIWTDSTTAERTIVFSPGSASEMLCWSSAIEQALLNAEILHLNGRHPNVCARAIQTANSAGVTISFDGGAYRYRSEIRPLLRAADIAIVARQFAESHYEHCVGEKATIGPAELAEFMMTDLRCKIVGVTDGAAGSFLIDSTGVCVSQPALATDQAVDTTGCGDTYHGAFLHAIAAGQNMISAARLAAEISSMNSRAMGALAF